LDSADLCIDDYIEMTREQLQIDMNLPPQDLKIVFNHNILEIANLFQVFGYSYYDSCNSALSLVGSGIRGVGLKI
jgi:hypothetical protein